MDTKLAIVGIIVVVLIGGGTVYYTKTLTASTAVSTNNTLAATSSVPTKTAIASSSPQKQNTTRIAIDPVQYGFTKDNQHVWAGDSLIVGADPATFSFIAGDQINAGINSGGTFSKDKNHVYYTVVTPSSSTASTAIISEANPATFHLLLVPNSGQGPAEMQTGYETDGTGGMHVYYLDSLISGVDFKTFTIVATYNSDTGFLEEVNGVDARDKNHTYFRGKIVQ